jgi:serine-protein kinase ATM
MKPAEVATALRSKRDEKATPEMLHALFIQIRERFRPVMRHFFTEKHKTPTAWFAMRLNYTRSVATTSVVGHVIGLGDRHTSNILVDNGTGEVVHIDLGIAFEQVRSWIFAPDFGVRD